MLQTKSETTQNTVDKDSNHNTVSKATTSETKIVKQLPDKKNEQGSAVAEMKSTVSARFLFSDFFNNDLSNTSLLPFLSPLDLAKAARTNHFFANASRECWKRQVQNRFSAVPVPKMLADYRIRKLRPETYHEMFERLQGWDADIRMELKKSTPNRRDHEAVLLHENRRKKLFANIVANGYDKFDQYYPEFRPSNMDMVLDTKGDINTFAHVAAFHGQAEFLRKILEWGGSADIPAAGFTLTFIPVPSINGLSTLAPKSEWVPGTGKTALILAASKGYLAVLQVLLDNPKPHQRPNVNYQTRDSNGITALHAAAEGGHLECVRYLLVKGARTDLRNRQDNKPIDCAKDEACRALIREKMEERQETSLSSMCTIS